MLRNSREDNIKMTSLKNLLSSSARLTKYQLTQIFISGGFSEINEKVRLECVCCVVNTEESSHVIPR